MLKVHVRIRKDQFSDWQTFNYHNVSSVKVLHKSAFLEEGVDEYSYEHDFTEMMLRITFRSDPRDCYNVQTATFCIDDNHRFRITEDE